MKRNVLISYRWKDRAEAKWLFWLEKKLKLQGFGVAYSDFPKLSDQKGDWIADIQNAYEISESNVHIVEHDPGTLTILKYLESIARHKPHEPSLLIAGSPKVTYSEFQTNSYTMKALMSGEQNLNLDVRRFQKDISHLDIKLVILYGGELMTELEQAQLHKLTQG